MDHTIALPEQTDAVKRVLGLKSQAELHPFTKTRLYERLAAHFGKLGIPLVFNPLSRYELEIKAGDIKIGVNFGSFYIAGRREALQAVGFNPEWFPGAPGQKKTVGHVSTTCFERHRAITLRASGPRRIDVFLELYDDETEELRRIRDHERDSEAASARIADAQSKANKQIAALPASAQEFLGRWVNAFGAYVKGAMATFSADEGGYTIAPDDLEDIKRALHDALNALRDASIRFDERKRQAEILRIVDKNIDSAMPTCSQPEVRHG